MTFTSIESGRINQLIEAADLNTYVRDNLSDVHGDAHLVCPVGAIMLWQYDPADLPSNWAVCNGTGGRPNLKAKFVPVAGSTYAVDATGGAAVGTPSNHSAHSFAAGSDHSAHSLSGANSHSKMSVPTQGVATVLNPATIVGHTWSGSGNQHAAHSGGSVNAHSAHLIGGATPSVVLPAWLALHYVQKTAVAAESWSTPHTFADGDVPTASQLNVLIRDLPKYLLGQQLLGGGIGLWHGAIVDIPSSNYDPCDGSGAGRVDTRDRFVIGVDDVDYFVGVIGGETGLTYDAHTNHTTTPPGDHGTHTLSIPAHVNNGPPYIVQLPSNPSFVTLQSGSSHGGSVSGGHSHASMTVTGGHTHSSFSPFPPYYALPFIQAGLQGFTTPRTWSDDEIFSASFWNTYVRDNIEALHRWLTLQHVLVWWAGSIASIPAGWANSAGASGTIDLRNKFIIGAGATYAVGATGGATSLVIANHSAHSVTIPAHSDHTVNLPGAHNAGGQPYNIDSSATFTSDGMDLSQTHTGAWATSAHSAHSGTGPDAHSAHSSINTTPPYHALALIERTS